MACSPYLPPLSLCGFAGRLFLSHHTRTEQRAVWALAFRRRRARPHTHRRPKSMDGLLNCLRCIAPAPGSQPSSTPTGPPRLTREDSWKYVNRFAAPAADDAGLPIEQQLQDSFRDPLWAALNGRRPPSFREQMVPPIGSASRVKQMSRASAASTGGSTRTTGSYESSSSSSRSTRDSGRQSRSGSQGLPASDDAPSYRTATAAMAEAYAKKAELANARANAAAASAAAKALNRPVTPPSSKYRIPASPSTRERAAARLAAKRAAAAAAAREPYMGPAFASNRRGMPGCGHEAAAGSLPASYMATTKSTAQGKKSSVDSPKNAGDAAPNSPWKADRRDWERMRWDEKYFR